MVMIPFTCSFGDDTYLPHIRFSQGCLCAHPPPALPGRPPRPPDKEIFEYIMAYFSIFEVFLKNIQRICPIRPVRADVMGKTARPPAHLPNMNEESLGNSAVNI
jgi:hypothetical protein